MYVNVMCVHVLCLCCGVSVYAVGCAGMCLCWVCMYICMLNFCSVCKCDVGTRDVLVQCVLVCMCDIFVLLVCTCVGGSW